MILFATSCNEGAVRELSLEDASETINSNVYVFPTDDTFSNSTRGRHELRIDLTGNKNLNKDVCVHIRAFIGNSQTWMRSPIKIPKGRTYSNPIAVTIPGSYRVEVYNATSPAKPHPSSNVLTFVVDGEGDVTMPGDFPDLLIEDNRFN